MDDMRAVMETVGSESAFLLGHSEGGTMCSLFTAHIRSERRDRSW